MPARWFRRQFGITAQMLRSAYRRGLVRAVRHGQLRYSVADARLLWPEDVLWSPPATAPNASDYDLHAQKPAKAGQAG
jgi:hypothetical protein